MRQGAVSRSLVLFLVVAVLAGCLGGDDDPGPGVPEPEPEEEPFQPRVVLALIDTGIQPYHHEFRQRVEDPRAHPSTYIPGFPVDTPGLDLSLNAPDMEAAREADAELWGGTERDTMYWIPGTKFVGVVGIGADLPGGGHGTMVASRSGGNTISIPGEEILLVVVRAPLSLQLGAGMDPQAQATRWAADQPWIDIQSHSWGWFVMCAGLATSHLWGWADAFKYARDRQLVFVAAANGHGNAGLLGYPSQCQDNNPAGVTVVGGTDNGGLVRWANWFPHVAADACRNPTVNENTMDEIVNTGGGTSSATPFTAGGAAKILLEARRIFLDPATGVRAGGVIAEAQPGAVLPETGPLADGVFTMDELREILHRTAISPPEGADSDGEACDARIDVPPGATPESLYPFIGYGEVNGYSVEHALAVIRGEAALPERSNEDALYQADQEARLAIWG